MPYIRKCCGRRFSFVRNINVRFWWISLVAWVMLKIFLKPRQWIIKRCIIFLNLKICIFKVELTARWKLTRHKNNYVLIMRRKYLFSELAKQPTSICPSNSPGNKHPKEHVSTKSTLSSVYILFLIVMSTFYFILK